MRSPLRAVCLVMLLSGAPGARAADAPAAAGPVPVPVASAVVVRGTTDLADTVGACLARFPSRDGASGVAVVLDATDETRKASPDLARAFAGAVSRATGKGPWQVGSLGTTLTEPVGDANAVATAVMATLARSVSGGPDTLGRLRTTLRGSQATLVVYVADERFEDAVDLEGFIAECLAAGRTLCVIGPEAAFERPWRTLFAMSERGVRRASPEVGVSPFEPDDPAAPWHSGDSAYPLIPCEFTGGWRTESHEPLREDLAERREQLESYLQPPPAASDAEFHHWAKQHVVPPDPGVDPDGFRAWRALLGPPPDRAKDRKAAITWLSRLRASAPPSPEARASREALLRSASEDRPLPSGFGPYGLMRAAGVTGGCYVLWRWGRERADGASSTYVPARCDEFGPDLRARAEIFADVASRPRSRALMRAWTLLSTSRPPLCRTTVPMWAGRHAALDHQSSFLLPHSLRSVADRDHAVAVARAGRVAAGRVREMLDGEVAGLGVPGDSVDRRLQADVDLLLHALESIHFELGEIVAAARALPADSWPIATGDPLDLWPHPVADGDGELRDGGTGPSAAFHDPAAGAALRASRKAFLARYRGTPFGAMAMLNRIATFGPPAEGR